MYITCYGSMKYLKYSILNLTKKVCKWSKYATVQKGKFKSVDLRQNRKLLKVINKKNPNLMTLIKLFFFQLK